MRRAQVLVCPDDSYFNPVFDFVSCEFTENRPGFEQVPSNAPAELIKVDQILICLV